MKTREVGNKSYNLSDKYVSRMGTIVGLDFDGIVDLWNVFNAA